MTRRAAAALLVASLFLPLHCRRAEGVPKDPMLAEAEDALVAYLRIDTSRANETDGATYLQQLLVKEGIDAQLIGANPQRQAVYARLQSGTNEKALLLLSHIDVVPAVPSEWTKPPYGGVRSGGYLFGRGAIDDKSLTIAELMALVDLERRGVKLRRDVIFLAVPDEELGGLQGMKALLETRADLFANVGFVVNEGGVNTTVVDRVVSWGIEVQQKVPLWLRVTTEGVSGHGAAPPADGGTAEKLVRALANVADVETPYRLSPSVAETAAVARRVRKDVAAAKLRWFAEPLDLKAVDTHLPPPFRNLLRDTITITRIHAGTSVNVVPATASADVDVRLLPDSDAEAMIGRIRDAVGKDGKVEVLLKAEPSPMSPIDSDLYRVLTRVMTRSEPGSTVAPIVGLGTTDSRFFRARGIAAYGIGAFKINYYDADTVHGVDERIRARFFADGVVLMRRIVTEFCAAPQ